MSSIAVFPCKYTPFEQIGQVLVARLGLQLYTDAMLVAATAARTGEGEGKLEKLLYSTTSVFNQFTLEREMATNHCRATLARLLASGDRLLLHGFTALLVPASIGHVLKVLVVDGRRARTVRAMAEGLSERAARKRIHAADVSAYGWSDFLYKKEAYDRSLYDLVIPVEGRTPHEIGEEIIRAYRTTSVLPTLESSRAVLDMVLAAEVERHLLREGHKVRVHCIGGEIRLEVEKNVLSFGRLEKELIELVLRVEGVKAVRVVRSPEYTVSIYRRQRFELPSKVLFVDDEKEFVQTVANRLISRDVGTYGVYNGEDALELVAGDRPDVMVLDLKMPGLSGVEVLRRTKEMAPEVEVIILTGHGSSKEMRECMELGAFAYMNKPVDIEELSSTIREAHARVRSRLLSGE